MFIWSNIFKRSQLLPNKIWVNFFETIRVFITVKYLHPCLFEQFVDWMLGSVETDNIWAFFIFLLFVSIWIHKCILEKWKLLDAKDRYSLLMFFQNEISFLKINRNKKNGIHYSENYPRKDLIQIHDLYFLFEIFRLMNHLLILCQVLANLYWIRSTLIKVWLIFLSIRIELTKAQIDKDLSCIWK